MKYFHRASNLFLLTQRGSVFNTSLQNYKFSKSYIKKIPLYSVLTHCFTGQQTQEKIAHCELIL